MMIWMISEPWLLSRSAELRTAISSTPAITPCMAPRPPKMETPPSSTDAITLSSKPIPVSVAAESARSIT